MIAHLPLFSHPKPETVLVVGGAQQRSRLRVGFRGFFACPKAVVEGCCARCCAISQSRRLLSAKSTRYDRLALVQLALTSPMLCSSSLSRPRSISRPWRTFGMTRACRCVTRTSSQVLYSRDALDHAQLVVDDAVKYIESKEAQGQVSVCHRSAITTDRAF